eukprot:8007012-Prorocentrum_lima.AAC.1
MDAPQAPPLSPRQQRAQVDQHAADILQTNRYITVDDVWIVLQQWGLLPNTTRTNIMGQHQTFVYSDTFG